jgi:DNA polymerase I
VRVYRTNTGVGAVVPEVDDEGATELADPRDYDVAHYERVLRDNFASRLARAFTPDDFGVVFADPDQASLFAPPVDTIRPVLTKRVVNP